MTGEAKKTRFWLVLATINIAAMIYPVSQYVRASSDDTQLFTTIVLFGTAFLLAIADAVSAIVVYMC